MEGQGSLEGPEGCGFAVERGREGRGKENEQEGVRMQKLDRE